MKSVPDYHRSLNYAFKLADVVELVANKDTLDSVNLMANLIDV